MSKDDERSEEELALIRKRLQQAARWSEGGPIPTPSAPPPEKAEQNGKAEQDGKAKKPKKRTKAKKAAEPSAGTSATADTTVDTQTAADAAATNKAAAMADTASAVKTAVAAEPEAAASGKAEKAKPVRRRGTAKGEKAMSVEEKEPVSRAEPAEKVNTAEKAKTAEKEKPAEKETAEAVETPSEPTAEKRENVTEAAAETGAEPSKAETETIPSETEAETGAEPSKTEIRTEPSETEAEPGAESSEKPEKPADKPSDPLTLPEDAVPAFSPVSEEAFEEILEEERKETDRKDEEDRQAPRKLHGFLARLANRKLPRWLGRFVGWLQKLELPEKVNLPRWFGPINRMNLPNQLTLLRILLIPVMMGILYWGFPGSRYVALLVFIIASITDTLDGRIARKYNLVTDFGKFADPLADKMLVTAAMLWFVQTGHMPAWALLIVVCREFAVSGLRMLASGKGRVIAAGWSGKVKTAATMICLVLMFFPVPAVVNMVCVWVITLTTLYSGVEYFVLNRDVIASV